MVRLFLIVNHVKIFLMVVTIGFGLYLFFVRNGTLTIGYFSTVYHTNGRNLELDADELIKNNYDSHKNDIEEYYRNFLTCSSNFDKLSTFVNAVNNVPLLPLEEDIILCLMQIGNSATQLSYRKRSTFSFAVFPETWRSLGKLSTDFRSNNCLSEMNDACIRITCKNVTLKFIKLKSTRDFFMIPSCDDSTTSQYSNIFLKFQEFRSFKFHNLSLITPLDLQLYSWMLKNSKYIECNLTFANEYKRNNSAWYQVDGKLTVGNFEWLVELRNLLYILRMPPLLAGGTLLGWRRECGIIPYTHDFDFLVPIDLYNDGLENVLKSHKRFLLKHKFGKPTDSLEYTVSNNENARADIFFLYNEHDHSWVGGLGLRRTKLKYIYPPLTNICATVLLGCLFHIPCNADDFIRADYGANWLTPDQNYRWYDHGVKVGEWSADELKNLNLKY